MTLNHSLSWFDNQKRQTKKLLANIQFENKLQNLSELDWENKKRKHKYTILDKKTCINTVTW